MLMNHTQTQRWACLDLICTILPILSREEGKAGDADNSLCISGASSANDGGGLCTCKATSSREGLCQGDMLWQYKRLLPGVHVGVTRGGMNDARFYGHFLTEQ
uniref:Master replication protein n=1 Tax=Anthurium amnicola TaxID=1678845 RepID=A0A1D1Z8Q4_9ARAE